MKNHENKFGIKVCLITITLVILISLIFSACSKQFNGQDPDELIELFFSRMNEREFKAATDLCHFEPARTNCLDFTDAETFISNMELGANIRYEIISLIDGAELAGLRMDDPRGMAYYFPDERENECKTYWSTIRYHIKDETNRDVETFVFSQKISVEKIDGKWVMGKMRYPGDPLCTDKAYLSSEVLEPNSSTPEALLHAWYKFINEGKTEQAIALIAENSPDYQSFSKIAGKDTALGEIWQTLVNVKEVKDCKGFESNQYQECQQATVLQQDFYGVGFIAHPSGAVLSKRFEMVLTENGWRLWRMLLP